MNEPHDVPMNDPPGSAPDAPATATPSAGSASGARTTLDDALVAKAAALFANLDRELRRMFVGQDELVRGLLCAVAAGGHVLVESLPGLGKTLLVKAVGKLLGLTNNRIQFTPDLMPSDITGSHVLDPATKQFTFHNGPVFTQFLLADELNRAPAKTHAALLEAMQERQVTLDGTRYPLPAPFLVMATQNPIDQEGTYTLPEAALDRFMFKLVLTYPSAEEEERILSLFLSGRSPEAILTEDLRALTDARVVGQLQRAASLVTVDARIVTYITQIVRATRGAAGLYLGASPRAGIAMLAAARATALSRGRGYVVPDDIADVALPALRHRVILSPETEIEGRTADAIITDLIAGVAVPRA